MPLIRRQSQAVTTNSSCSLKIPDILHVDKTIGVTLEPALEAFLDEVAAGLWTLPSIVKYDIRREMRQHLESLVNAHIELGDSREDAIRAAIARLGKPGVIAGRFLRVWKTSGANRQSSLLIETAKNAGLAVSIALFACACLCQWANCMYAVERSGGHGISLLPEFLGLPLIMQVLFLIPVWIGHRFGIAWHQDDRAPILLWARLVLQVMFAACLEFLVFNMVSTGRQCWEASRWDALGSLKSAVLFALPISITFAIFTRLRRASCSRLQTAWQFAAAVGWLLICLIDELDSYNSPAGPKSWFSPWRYYADNFYLIFVVLVVGAYFWLKQNSSANRDDPRRAMNV